MRNRDICAPDAFIFDPSDELRRDLQIYLVRNCGLNTAPRSEIADFDPAQSVPVPRLIITSGFENGRGLELIRRVRALGLSTFIIYIDRNQGPDEAGDAFASGADDVIRTPFTLREFGLRLRTRLGQEFVSHGRSGGLVPNVMLDAENRLLAAGCDGSVQLTPAEAEVMAVLIQRGGLLVTRDDLSREIDHCNWMYGDRKFDVHITKIRRKLKAAFDGRYEVRSVRSEGYMLVEAAASVSAARTPTADAPV